MPPCVPGSAPRRGTKRRAGSPSRAAWTASWRSTKTWSRLVPSHATPAPPELSSPPAQDVAPGPRPVLLLIAYWHPAGLTSGSPRSARLARALAAAGWRVVVLSGPRPASQPPLDSPGIEVVEVGGESRNTCATSEAEPTGVDPAQDAERPAPLWRRLAREAVFLPDPQVYWIGRAQRAVLDALGPRRVGAIIASAPPFSMFLLGRRLSRALKSPLVLDYRDVWTTHPWWPLPRWRRPLERLLEGRLLRSAALVL